MSPLRLALPLLLLALPGCSLFASDPAPAARAETPQERACRQEAEASPGVRGLAAYSNPNNPQNQVRIEQERRRLIGVAYRDCLRRNGVPLSGGVEAERPR